jgi:NADH:ubiquinone oxidoreductase subunit E
LTILALYCKISLGNFESAVEFEFSLREKEMTDILAQFTTERANLVPILQKVQEKEGYISNEAVKEIGCYLGLTGNDIYSVASFYAQFRFERQGKHTIKVCQGTACHVRGGHQLLEAVERELCLPTGKSTTEDYQFTLERVACFGSCALAPVMVIDSNVFGKVSIAQARKLIGQYRE